MPRIGAGSHLLFVVIALAIFLPFSAASRAAASKEDVCDADADFALGLADYPTAIALHRNVIGAQTDNALAHYHLGFAYGMTGRKGDEINEYRAAARLGLDKWDLFLNLGLAYLGQNDESKAVKALQIAALLGPNHPEAHFDLAIACEKANMLAEALQEIVVSLRLAPEDPDEENAKGIICARMGNLVCAREEWEHLVQVTPDYVPARVNLAVLNRSHMSLASTFKRSAVRGYALRTDGVGHSERSFR